MHNKKLWSQSPTSSHLTSFGESLISQEFRAAKKWKHYRIATHEWLVSYKEQEVVPSSSQKGLCSESIELIRVDIPESDDRLDSKSNSLVKMCGPIPQFRRIYKVTVTDDDRQVMSCSCGTQDRMGFPCRHIGAVLSEPDVDGVVMLPNFRGFPISSVRVFWWSILYRYGTSDNLHHQPLRNKLLHLVHNDTPGYMLSINLSKFPGHIRDWPGIKHQFNAHPRLRLLNYTPLEASDAWQVYINEEDPNFPNPPGLSQLSFLTEEDTEPADVDCDSALDQFMDETVHISQLDGDLQNVRALLKTAFNEMCNAISDSNCIKGLTMKAESMMNNIATEARSKSQKRLSPRDKNGKRISMLPASNRKRKHNASSY